MAGIKDTIPGPSFLEGWLNRIVSLFAATLIGVLYGFGRFLQMIDCLVEKCNREPVSEPCDEDDSEGGRI